MSSHIRQGFIEPGNQTRLRPIDRDTTIAPGITAMLAPGHTPGHLCVVISSGQERALLLGDAVTCPVRLDEPTWHSIADVDPALADRTRELLWRELENDHSIGAAHTSPNSDSDAYSPAQPAAGSPERSDRPAPRHRGTTMGRPGG